MAMTIKSSPNTFDSAHNDLVFVVDSTNKNADKHKYICDVYIGSVSGSTCVGVSGGTRVARMKNPPNPTFVDYGVFNVNKIVQSYLDSNYFNNPTQLQEITPYICYRAEFGERYEVAGVETISYAAVVDTVRRGFNAAFSRIDNESYVSGVSGRTAWLTDRSRSQYYPTRATDPYFLSGINDIGEPTAGIRLRYFSDYNGVNETSTEDVACTFDYFIANMIASSYTFPVGTKSFKIGVIYDLNAVDPIVDEIGFNLDACGTREHLVFLNRYGGYESVYFDKASKPLVSIERKTMLAPGFEYNTSTFKLDAKTSNGVFYEQMKTYGTKYTEKIKINSDWLSDADYLWLKGLLLSPVIYYRVTLPQDIYFDPSESFYVPVMIKQDSWEVKRKVNEKLTQVELEIEIGFNNYTQSR
jgi:hypothetical protein